MTVAYWAVVLCRVWILLQQKPTIRAGLDAVMGSDERPRISIIVPAHNEERVIDACCRGLRAQSYENIEIIVVLDRCTDRTGEIVRSHAAEDDRIIMIENDHCPEGWAGKCYAAHLGATQSTEPWLLFTDADTAFDPRLCEAAVAMARRHNLGLLSLLSDLTFYHHYERVAQPVAAMSLVRLYPFRRLGSNRRVRPFANGQFMLFDRVWYDRLGGHAAVKNELLEDLAFARKMRKADGKSATFLADGMLSCSMYDSLDRFRAGWKRIFIEACRRRPRRLRVNGWRLFFSGLVGPAILFAALVLATIMWVAGDRPLALALALSGTAGLVLMAVTLARIYRVNGAPLWATLFYPLGCWIVGRVMLEGANDLEQQRPVRWGGREYVLKPWHPDAEN